jgi:hypothetical protein
VAVPIVRGKVDEGFDDPPSLFVPAETGTASRR